MSARPLETVAIVGVGLIGASFGLAMKRAGFQGRVLGVSSAAAVREALDCGAIDQAAAFEEAARSADLIFLSQPIHRILDTLATLDAWLRPGVLVTDAGSTKARIVEQGRRWIRRAQFLGGHPMAGKEKRGAAAAEAGLFAGRTWVLTPLTAEELETEPAREFLAWIRAIGAIPLVLGPEEHDRIVAFTSHLPQLLSTALAATLQERLSRDEEMRVAGPGLLDMTRLAASSFEIWRDILATNKEAVGQALDACLAELNAIRAAVGSEELAPVFERAGRFARRLRGEG